MTRYAIDIAQTVNFTIVAILPAIPASMIAAHVKARQTASLA